MPTTLPIRRKRRIFSLRSFFLLAIFGIAIAALHLSFRDQYSELIAAYVPEQAERRTPEPGVNRLPTVVKLEPAPRSGAGGPKVIDLGPSTTGSLGAVESSGIRVVDGDTVHVRGKTYRLVGYDAPEGGARARCAAERDLATRAVRRLRQIVAGGNLKLQPVSCGCPAGTEGTDQCNHGRLCAVLTASDRDIAQILVGEGLARRYSCVGDHCPPKQGWCT